MGGAETCESLPELDADGAPAKDRKRHRQLTRNRRLPVGPELDGLQAHRNRFSSNATTETYDVKFLRQVRIPRDHRRPAASPRRMLAQHGNVHQTLVLVSANAPVAYEGASILRLIPPVVMGESVLRTTQRCRRYVRLIDFKRHVWFHVFQENSMKPLERLTHRVMFRSGSIVVAST